MTLSSLIITNEKDLLGLTLLHKAVKEQNIEAIRELILLKFDVNALTNYNNSPLHYAYETGNLELIDLNESLKYSKSIMARVRCRGSLAIYLAVVRWFQQKM